MRGERAGDDRIASQVHRRNKGNLPPGTFGRE
jgi:hypothetical protein